MNQVCLEPNKAHVPLLVFTGSWGGGGLGSTTRPAMSGPLNPSEDIEEAAGGKWSREIDYNVAPMSLTLTRTTVFKSEPLGSPRGSAV